MRPPLPYGRTAPVPWCSPNLVFAPAPPQGEDKGVAVYVPPFGGHNVGSPRMIAKTWPIGGAHRGASPPHPENTLASFEAALEAGADVVELDVRLTADRVPVVLHDPDVA